MGLYPTRPTKYTAALQDHPPKPAKRKARYAAYLKGAHWQAKRREALEFYGYVCFGCGGHQELQVHHKTYARIHDEPLEDLVILCEDCHSEAHKLVKQRKAKLRNAHEGVRVLRAGKPLPQLRKPKGQKQPKAPRPVVRTRVERALDMTPAEKRLEAKYQASRQARRAEREASM